MKSCSIRVEVLLTVEGAAACRMNNDDPSRCEEPEELMELSRSTSSSSAASSTASRWDLDLSA